MNQISFLIRQRWPVLLNGALLLLFCWLLAQWTWRIVIPAPSAGLASAPPFSAEGASKAILGSALFGRAVGRAEAILAAPTIASSSYMLLGVFSAIGAEPAYAILSQDNKPAIPFREGQEVAPGVLLSEVFSDYVLLKRQGSTERVNLQKYQVPASPVTESGRSFKLDVQQQGPGSFSFSRSELNTALQDPKQLVSLGRLSAYPGGGMMVEDASPGSLAAKLGLQVGDVVQRMNFQPVRSQADVQRFLKQLERVPQARVELVRAGRPMQLKYDIQQ